MLSILNKAKWIFLIVFCVYLLSFMTGFTLAKFDVVDYKKIGELKILKFSSSLEQYVPGYSHLINTYKDWHDDLRNKLISKKDHWGMRSLIFLNNWIVANITMIVRASFIFPAALSILGKFYQGAVFAQVSGGSQFWIIFLNEFGGYFLTISATLCLVFWTLFYKLFKFSTRLTAFISGIKVLGLAFIVSSGGMIIGSIVETKFIMDIYSLFK